LSYREAPTYEISFLFRRIVVPIDGSASSMKALDLAIDLAKHYGSSITVIHARPRGLQVEADPIEKAKERVAKAGVTASFKIIEYDLLRESDASAILSEIINGNYDLVIMGARGLTLSSDINIGSKALAVVNNSPITVIIVR